MTGANINGRVVVEPGAHVPTAVGIRVTAQQTWKLRKEALPRLTALLKDHSRSNLGAQVSVADAARAAIARLRGP